MEMESSVASSSQMLIQSQVKQNASSTLTAIKTKTPYQPRPPLNSSSPCFCGNQRLMKHHSANCKQQLLNWVLTGDVYTVVDDSTQSEYQTPNNFDWDTKSMNTSDIGTLPFHSTPQSIGTRPKQQSENQPQENPLYLYPAFGPDDLYQARLQQIHRTYQHNYQNVTNKKKAKILRVKFFDQLQDAQTSFQIVKRHPDILQLDPEIIQELLKLSPDKLKKKAFFKRIADNF